MQVQKQQLPTPESTAYHLKEILLEQLLRQLFDTSSEILKKGQSVTLTEANKELLLDLEKRLCKLEFAFTPQGLAKGIESVFRQKTEQAPEIQEAP